MNVALTRLRQQLGQLSWTMREYRKGDSLRKQVRAIRAISLPKPPSARGKRREIWGLSIVRDELDVLPSVIEHMFSQGLDRLLIADNRSQDGTREWLINRAKEDPRLLVALDEEPAHFQSAKMTWLAFQAWRAGAEWVVNFDADEFWFAEGESVAEFLRRQTGTAVVHASFHHMVPVNPAPDNLKDSEFMVDTTPSFPGKVAMRTHPFSVVGPGNHSAVRVGAQTRGLFIAHAQYRGPKQVARKVRQGHEAARLTGEDLNWFSPHWQSGATLTDSEVEAAFDRMSRGEPVTELGFLAKGPMVKARPLLWNTWNEDLALPECEPARTERPSNKSVATGYAVIIPTLQKSDKLPALVRLCEKHHLVSEILIINNAPEPYAWDSPKVRVLQQESNIYVNPAWNLGVAETSAPWLAILNDDILFDPVLFDRLAPYLNRTYVGIIGTDATCLRTSGSEGLWVGPRYARWDPFGVAMFMRRERYVPIPSDLKIWFGDDWLFTRQMRRNFVFGGFEIDTVVGTTSHRPEFVSITEADRRAYLKHGDGDYARRFRVENTLVHRAMLLKRGVRSRITQTKNALGRQPIK